jgi:hypothetical protein
MSVIKIYIFQFFFTAISFVGINHVLFMLFTSRYKRVGINRIKEEQIIHCPKEGQIIHCPKEGQIIHCLKEGQIIHCPKEGQIIHCPKRRTDNTLF